MKKQYSFSLIIACIGLFQPAIAQYVPETTIPISAVRNMLGVGPTENFALVYKGDTLASQISDGAVTKSKFFDEHITSIDLGDSVELKYVLLIKEGTSRLSLPDSNRLFKKEFRFADGTEHLVRYAKDGSEKYTETKSKTQKAITRISENIKQEIKSSNIGWSKHYKQLDMDSTYVAYYSVDSVLMSQSISVNFPNNERLHIYSKMNPYHYSLRRSYNSRDSNYVYYYLIHNGDTSITENLSHRFRDIDSAYECNSYSHEPIGLHGFTKRFVKSVSDSSYGYSSKNGGTVGWGIKNDNFSIAKDFNLNGALVSKEFKRFTDDDYDVEEILEKQDSFYHVINYYHKLNWKEDTNNVTSYFPYARQVYLNEDSVVTKELNYSFEKKNDWPVLTIMEGDSTWIENTSGGFSSKFARKVFICPGAITTGSAIYKADENTFNFTGVGSKKVRKSLLKHANTHFDLMFGVGVPPLYFIYGHGSGTPLHSFSMPYSKNYQSFNKILSESATRKASLYINGELKKIECTFLKLDFDWYWSRTNR